MVDQVELVERLRRSHGTGDLQLEAADAIDELVEALRRIAEQADDLTPNNERDQRLAWIDSELEAEPSRLLYGDDEEPPCRNGHEVTELIAERAGLIAQIALAKSRTPTTPERSDG